MSPQNELIRSAAEAKAKQEARVREEDWDSLPRNQQEALILTQVHEMDKE